ncbi:hypothetical protein [Acidocella facilis]|uniref:hypothetical protein n=1 Tax=Acidocella facilis TaxID=525 RepID=UPI001F470F6A|nr:hypothetical protein [Acidocella facilis]
MKTLETTAEICVLIQACGLCPGQAYAAASGAALRMFARWARSADKVADLQDEIEGASAAMAGIAAMRAGEAQP